MIQEDIQKEEALDLWKPTQKLGVWYWVNRKCGHMLAVKKNEYPPLICPHCKPDKKRPRRSAPAESFALALLMLVFALLAAPAPARAFSNVTIGVLSWQCSEPASVMLQISGDVIPGEPERFAYSVTNGDGEALKYENLMTTWIPNATPASINLQVMLGHAPTVNPVTITVYDQDTNQQLTGAQWNNQVDSPCVSPPLELKTENVAMLQIGTLVVVFAVPEPGAENDVFALDIWGIDDKGVGYPALYIDSATLAGQDIPLENALVDHTEDWTIAIYRLSTGEWQINVGPDEKGNVSVTIFDGLPPTNIYHKDFNIYEIEVVP